MINRIWCGMILVSVVCALLTGRMEEVSGAVGEGADAGIKLILSMAGVMGLWMGMMKIAETAGVTEKAARLLSPLLQRLMPDYPPGTGVPASVAANVAANMLGVGNAATPLGIDAMQRMKKSSGGKDLPNRSMMFFVVLNCASLQLIPTTVAALRQAAGSREPYGILPQVWLTSLGALAASLTAAAIFRRIGLLRSRKRRERHG